MNIDNHCNFSVAGNRGAGKHWLPARKAFDLLDYDFLSANDLVNANAKRFAFMAYRNNKGFASRDVPFVLPN